MPEGTAFIRSQNVLDHTLTSAGIARITDEAAQALRGVEVREGDVLLNITGDSIARCCIVDPNVLPARVSQHVAIIRVTHELNPLFLQKFLALPSFKAHMLSLSSGGTRPALTKAQIEHFEIPTPPRSVQDAVADVLGALDDKIAVNERTANTALHLAAAHYELASMSPEWRDLSLGEVATWHSGGTPRTDEPSYWGGTIPWISAGSLKSPWIDDSDRRVTELGAEKGTRLVPAGAVIFVVRGMSLKTEYRIGVTQREVAFGQDCKALLPRDGLNADVLFHAIRSRTVDILDLVDEAGHGTGRLATDQLERLRVRVPIGPADPIVAALQSLDLLAARRHQESRNLSELRDALLPKLMSGEIRVEIRVRDAEKAVENAT